MPVIAIDEVHFDQTIYPAGLAGEVQYLHFSNVRRPRAALEAIFRDKAPGLLTTRSEYAPRHLDFFSEAMNRHR